jgi:hypothetical protein
MSFEPPDGILDIGNATLRVGKLEVAETSGLNQGLLNIVKNNLLINENIEYSSSNTWGIKLPTTWVAEFDVKGHSTTKYVEFNFYNEDKTSNALGYLLNFKDTTLSLMYDTSLDDDQNILATATIPTIFNTYRKVNIFFERGVISVSIDGTQYLYHKETDGFNQGLGVASRVVSATGGAFVNVFIEENASNSAFKNLRIVNGRFISDKTSNIAFIGGNLGVGVNSPKETLDIRGNMHFNRVSNVSSISVDSNVVTEYTGPHDRPLRKYPEVAMTANDNSSTSGYVANASSSLTASQPYINFDGNLASHWHSRYPYYSTSTGAYSPGTAGDGQSPSGTLATNELVSGHQGEWVSIELPKKIKLEKLKVIGSTRLAESPPKTQFPKDVVVAVSETGLSGSWSVLETATLISQNVSNHSDTINITTQTSYYKYFALIVKSINSTASYSAVEIAELEFYGHEEGSGSLDTTLKTVYNVPATTGTQLEVYYDGQDYTDMPTVGSASVIDKAGGDQTGTPSSGVSFDSTYKAFVFDGTTNGKITTSIINDSGDWVHSASVWVKVETGQVVATSAYISLLGTTDGAGTRIAFDYKEDESAIRLGINAAYVQWNNVIMPNQWHHITYTYKGGSISGENYNLYVDGKYVEYSTLLGTTTLTLAQNTNLSLGQSHFATNYLKGSIANFRLYSKALNADQVKELYDYQKDYFLGSKSQVTLYKGHLGVGVTEPSGQLELAGDERIQEYPPRGMTANETLVEGHGVFCAYASSLRNGYSAWWALDKTTTVKWASDIGGGDTFGGGSGAYNGTNRLSSSTALGAWLKLKCPYKIKLYSFNIAGSPTAETPEDFIIYGSNDENTWDQLFQKTGHPANTDVKQYTVNSISYYKYFAVVITKVQSSTTIAAITEWRLFGTPGPTTLDKGSLTLGRSLDVPRISRYDVDTETPRPEKLIFHMDTTVNKWPVDISGRCCPMTVQNGAGYSGSEKAFKFDGTNDYVYGKTMIRGVEVNTSYTISLWVKTLADNNDNDVFFFLGSGSTGNAIGFRHGGSKDAYTLYHFANDNLDITGTGKSTYNEWRNLVATYDGTYQRIYIDGILAGERAVTGTGGGSSLHIGDLEQMSIGYRWSGGVANEYLTGYISNVKLWSVCLNKGEILQNYKLDRTGRSMVITDTAVGIGRHPEAQLDVGGTAIVRGSLSIGDRSGMNPAYLSAGEVSDTNFGDITMSAPLCVFSESMNGSDGFDIYRSLAKFCFGGPTTNPGGTYGYGLAIGVSANRGDSALQTINQGGDSNKGIYDYDLRLQPSGGNVGIGHAINPVAMLDVRGSVSTSLNSRYYNSSTSSTFTGNTNTTRPLSGYFESHLACAELQVFSDRRIKDNIRDIEDDSALQLFRKLKPKTYTYKDTLVRGTNHTYGFIAQEIREVLPLATSELSRDIPNIYEKAKLSKTGVLSFTNFDTSRLEANAMNIIMYTVDSDKRQEFEIDEVLSPKLIRLKGDLPPDEEVFVYGQYVDDFVSLNKNSIWTIATAALQEVDRQLQFERTRNDALEARVSALEQAKYM